MFHINSNAFKKPGIINSKIKRGISFMYFKKGRNQWLSPLS
ncbi:hypothetical protein D3OALGA1CA_5488 [Olavius algarvensis associated proteobacterium Delta 3]|nr:hypothetical protein D3OALGB2SA_1332 [Olavius algarvensis associated proteobacterium Delta 3]CAB5167560.1 hypothetical protein D3OALGA1CA_5488 [Olavius algarvensis associated proteobacterium Delta 3]